ncbi:hypothetical protein Ancab_020425, partial [Ancistrocladus abbreviatus]
MHSHNVFSHVSRSFTDVVKGKTPECTKINERGQTGWHQEKLNSSNLEFKSREEDRGWLKEC